MDTGMFQQKSTDLRRERAEVEVRHMGYEFQATTVEVSQAKHSLQVELQIVNRGVAPFYYDWPAEYGFITDGRVVRSKRSKGKMTGILPDAEARCWQDTLDTRDLPPGTYVLAMRVPNPLPNGLPVRFANETQDEHLEGWLSLTKIEQPSKF
jgi:hypothetical protein